LRSTMKVFQIYSILSLVTTHVAAQFGLPKNKEKMAGTSFEELNERMKQFGLDGSDLGGGGMDNLQAMMEKAFENPETMKYLEQMGEGIQNAFKDIGNMDPEEMQKNINEAVKMMTNGDIMDSVLDKKDEVLANLEKTGLVSAEELAKYKADPAYFEEQMRGAFDQMKGLFDNPDLMSGAAEALETMKDMMSNEVFEELRQLLMADTVTELEIEEMRLKLIADPNTMKSLGSGMAGLTEDDVKDAGKFKESFLEGRKMWQEMMEGGGGMMGQGAGVGEL